jgi:hypothetical protein
MECANAVVEFGHLPYQVRLGAQCYRQTLRFDMVISDKEFSIKSYRDTGLP